MRRSARLSLLAGMGLAAGLMIAGGYGVVSLQPCVSPAFQSRFLRLTVLEAQLQEGILARRLGLEVGSEVAAAVSDTSDVLASLLPLPTCLAPTDQQTFGTEIAHYQAYFKQWQQNYSALESGLGDVRGVAAALKEKLARGEAASPEDGPLLDVLRQSLMQATLDSSGVPRVRDLIVGLQARLVSQQSQQGSLGRLVAILQNLPSDGPVSIKGRSTLNGSSELLPLLMQWIAAQSRVEEAMRQLQTPGTSSGQALLERWRGLQAGRETLYGLSEASLLLGLGLLGGLGLWRRGFRLGRVSGRVSDVLESDMAGGGAAGARSAAVAWYESPAPSGGGTPGAETPSLNARPGEAVAGSLGGGGGAAGPAAGPALAPVANPGAGPSVAGPSVAGPSVAGPSVAGSPVAGKLVAPAPAGETRPGVTIRGGVTPILAVSGLRAESSGGFRAAAPARARDESADDPEAPLLVLYQWLELAGERAYFLDEEGRVLDLTTAAAALLGRHRADLLRIALLPLLLPEMLHAEYRAYFAGEKPLPSNGHLAELVVRVGGQPPRPTRALLFRAELPGPGCFVLVLNDLNANRAAQDLEDRLRVNTLQLERSSLELRLVKARETAIREAAIDAILGVDVHGQVVDFNPAAESTFGMTAAAAKGLPLAAFIALPGQTGEFLRGVDGRVSLARTFPPRSRLEVTAMRGDGAYFPAELMLIEVPQYDTTLHYVFVRDITERRRVEQVKNEFVSVVSHELRTPLTSIRGSLGLLEGGVMGTLPEPVLEMIRIARTNAERLIRLTSDMLDLEKMEAGRMTLKLDAMPIGELFEGAAAAVSGFATQAGVVVRIAGAQTGEGVDPAVQGGQPEHDMQAAQLHQLITGDRDRLQQVLINLLSNAIKFSSPGQSVWMRVLSLPRSGHEAGWFRFEVQDSGPGIPLDLQDLLFLRFQQLESNDGRARRGTGLGLAISRAIVELHGGRIGVRSTPGQGSTFFFELPGQRGANRTDGWN